MSTRTSYRDDPRPVPRTDFISYELELPVFAEAGEYEGRTGFFAESHDRFSDTRFFRSTLGEALEALLLDIQPNFPGARFRVRFVESTIHL